MVKKVKLPSIVAKTEDGAPVVEVFSMKTEGDILVMDVKALDSMRMCVIVKVEDIAKGWPVIKANMKDILSFGRKIPKALRLQKRINRELNKTSEA